MNWTVKTLQESRKRSAERNKEPISIVNIDKDSNAQDDADVSMAGTLNMTV